MKNSKVWRKTMKNRLKIICLVIVIIAMVSVGCSNAGEQRTPEAEHSKDTETAESMDEDIRSLPMHEAGNVRYISSISCRMTDYKTIDELAEAAPYIVTGNVMESKTVFQNETMYTVQTIQITDVIKGSLEVGENIPVIEYGGTTTFAEYDEKVVATEKYFEDQSMRTDPDQVIVEGEDGHFPMETGQDVLLFLGGTSGFLEDFDGTLYDVMGAYDGKLYRIDHTTYAQSAPNETSELLFRADSETISVTLDELDELKEQFGAKESKSTAPSGEPDALAQIDSLETEDPAAAFAPSEKATQPSSGAEEGSAQGEQAAASPGNAQ